MAFGHDWSECGGSVDEGARHGSRRGPVAREKESDMIILLALLLVLLFFGLGFAIHFLWIVAVVFFVLWLVGFAVGRGESSGSHRFYRW
jgi:hypothetical protein